MKKLYSLLFVVLFNSAFLNAAQVQVSVTYNVFIPADFTVNVGDTVTWIWEMGMHTTTSTDVPAGAASWNALIDGTHKTFMYPVTEAGTYTYQCNNHIQLGMTGGFTAIQATGINENDSPDILHVKKATSGELKVELNTSKSGVINLRLYNIIGKEIREFSSSQQNAGSHEFTCNVSDLAKGIYLMRLSVADVDIVRRVILE